MGDQTNYIVVGAQFGDEGKNQVAYALASGILGQEIFVIVKPVGGNDSFKNMNSEIIARDMIPSTMNLPGRYGIIGSAAFIDVVALANEIKIKEGRNPENNLIKRITLSDRANVLLSPLYMEIAKRGGYGHAGNGLSYAYYRRSGGEGIRMCDFDEGLLDRIDRIIKECGLEHKFNTTELHLQQVEAFRRVMDNVKNTQCMLYDMMNDENPRPVLLQGSKGTFSDTVFGMYPLSISFDTIASACLAGAGIGPRHNFEVWGVAKAVITKGGNFPLPTEINIEAPRDDIDAAAVEALKGLYDIKNGERFSWPDIPLLRQALVVNGLDYLALTEIDRLSSLETIRVCKGYEIPGEIKMKIFPPASTDKLAQAKPVYEEVSGWKSSLKGVKTYDELPSEAKYLIGLIEEQCQVDRCCLSGKSVKVPIRLVGIDENMIITRREN